MPGDHGTAFRHVFRGVMLPLFLGAADQTILAPALPAIGRDLGVEAMSGAVIAFLLGATVAAPLAGQLGDLYGRRPVLIAALGALLAGSVVAALSQGAPGLGLGRAVQGLGGGAMHTLATSLIAEVVPPRERGRYQGYLGAVFLCAATLGPMIGGGVAQVMGWRWIFWIHVPLIVLAGVLARGIPAGDAPPRDANQRFDWLGAVLLAVAASAALLALDRVGKAPLDQIALPATVSLLTAAIFILIEPRRAHPLVPLAVLRLPSVYRADLLMLCVAGTSVASVTFLPIFFQAMLGKSAAVAGALLLPLSLTAVAASTVTGLAISRTGRAAIFPTMSLPIAAVALIGLAWAADGRGGIGFAMAMLILLGFGNGTGVAALMTIVQASAPRERLGSATATANLARAFGGALAVAAVCGILEGFGGGLAALRPEVAAATRVHAFTILFAALTVLPLLGTVAAALIPLRRL